MGENILGKKVGSKFLLAVIFFLLSIIFINGSDEHKAFYKEEVFSKNIPFNKISLVYEKFFGSVLPGEDLQKVVQSEKLLYTKISPYEEGEVLSLKGSEVINSLASGVVVFAGDKEGYGKTVIIQGADGADIWYGNLTNVSAQHYDYVKKDTVIGETKDNKLYLVIKKNNEYIKYEDYKN